MTGSGLERITRWLERLNALGRRWVTRAWATARDPLRVLPVLAIVALLFIGIPYTATGVSRVAHAGMHWRAESGVQWHRTVGTVTGVRENDGMVVRVRFHDDQGHAQVAKTYLADPSRRWLTMRVPMRFDPHDVHRIELIGYDYRGPVAALLIAGAPLGAGVASLVLAVGLWRRRRLVAVSATPVAVLRRPITVALTILVAGIGAWAAGTVIERGWRAIASSTGHLVSTVFGDLLGVVVPVVAFALGALVTAWLARHRHHEQHHGLLSKAHGLIDRAAEMVPSPEDLAPQEDVEVPSGR
jgi:hypothetical protein